MRSEWRGREEGRGREREEGGREGRKEKKEGKRMKKGRETIDNKWSVHGLITGLKSTLVMYSASTLVTVHSVM